VLGRCGPLTISLRGLICGLQTARASAGSDEVPGRALPLAAACLALLGRRSFLAAALAWCRGEAWLKKVLSI
jgi:hypothetical protein